MIFFKHTILFIFTLFFTTVGWGAIIEPFDVVNPDGTKNVQGNYAIAGNTVMCLTKNESGYSSGEDEDNKCRGMTDYELETSNGRVSKYLDIDGDSSTWNSTSSYITVPVSFDLPSVNDGKGILWAGLFWQGRISNRTNYKMRYGKETTTGYDLIETGKGSSYSPPSSFNDTGAGKIKLQVDTGSYEDVTAETLYKQGSGGRVTYAAFADVTDIVKPAIQTSGKHVFTVANLTTNEGRESSPGVFGGWSIVVIYAENSFGKMRNISVYSGFDSVSNPSDPFKITDFLLPKTNTVNATLSLFSGEGEYLYGRRPGTSRYDWVKLSDDGSNYSFMPGAAHKNNIFDGTFTGITRDKISGEYNDLEINNDGVDVDTFDVSALTTIYRDKNPNLNEMYVQWSSNNDYITPSMLVFAVQLYAPKLCYDYSLKQDNSFLKVDRTTTPIAGIHTHVSSSDIGLTLYLKNIEADIAAEGISIRSDVNTTIFEQTGYTYSSNTNGSTLIYRGSPTDESLDYDPLADNSTTNNGSTDGHNVRKGLGSLSAQDYIYSNFSIKPVNAYNSNMDESLGLTIDYSIRVNGTTITYTDYQLGGPYVELCPPTGNYTPTFGLFNVVQSGLTTNNINTQISRRTFNTDVIFDSNPQTGENDAPTTDITTTVLVEIIDMDSFGDINASCANPDSRLSTPIFVPINFDSTTGQTPIPAQIDDYYNFAVKNAAFRIWYFEDSDGNLIQDWSASTTDGGKSLTSIADLYDETIHAPLCESACLSTTSTGCFECIQVNFARPLCSRDNFSVRPESYDMHIIDRNLTVEKDLSKIYDYSPDSLNTPTDNIQIAAYYTYELDLNATGNDGIARVPGYTRNFNNANDHNSTILWNSLKGLDVCNDVSDTPLSFYVKDGTLSNIPLITTNVGEYKLNIIDETWTAVDWESAKMSHHTSGFLGGSDCIKKSNSSILFNSQYGCTIDSNHGTDKVGNFYRDQKLESHPYGYTLTNTLTVGPLDIVPHTNKPFVYMADLDQDEPVSVHLNTLLTPNGFNQNTALTNYVNGCYAKPINMSISKTATRSTTLSYKLRHHDLNNSIALPTLDIDLDIAPANINNDMDFLIPTTYFQKEDNGTTSMRTDMNYNRVINIAANPEDINFTSYKAEDNVTLINADLVNNKIATTTSSLNNQRVIHYYGRTIAPDIRVNCTTNKCRTGLHSSNTNSIKETVSFVVYCESVGGTVCSTNPVNGVLPDAAQQVVDIRWWENRNHDKPTTGIIFLPQESDGVIGTITDSASPSFNKEISRTLTNNNFASELVLEHNGPLPYDSLLQLNSSNWLLYSPDNANATSNTFLIEWRGDGGWSGKYEDKTTTKSNAATTTNGRVMW